MNIVNVNMLHAAVLLKTLAKCGAKRAVISPGSRSTPLALVAREMPELETFTIVDERAAAFFALGLSKADDGPAILICTSGTAAVNYFPAMVEASQSCVPLIALSADRPAELRESGAPQTINQVHLFGGYSRFFADLPPAQLSLDHVRAIRTSAIRAYTEAVSVPCGPVHINVPFDEPLAPVSQNADEAEQIFRQLAADDDCSVAAQEPPLVSNSMMDAAAARARESLCGLIVCGPDSARMEDDAQAIFLTARRLGFPIFADVLSGLRFLGEPVFPFYDVFLRKEALASLAPDCVLAFGAHPISKSLNAYLDRHRDGFTLRVQPDARGRDPNSRATETIITDVGAFCRDLARRVPAARDSLLYEPFRAAAGRVRSALNTNDAVLCEAQFVHAAVRALPDRANVIFANSMSVRYGDALCAAEGMTRSAFGMRGASGIDGTISHALGIAAASQQPSLLVCGDLAFLHDLNGLAAARFAPNLSILLLNNDGGGIFHFLPVHERENNATFAAIHGTPHGLNAAAARDLFHLDWNTVTSLDELTVLMRESSPRMRVIEARTTREENYRAYNSFMLHLQAAAVT